MVQTTLGICRTVLFTCVLILVLARTVPGQRLAFNNPPKQIEVDETTPPGTIIGSLRLENGKNLKITSENDYVKVNETKRGINFVEVNIILGVTLDYDHGSQQLLQCRFKGADDNEELIWQLPLIVRNINDEEPVLQNRPYSVSVQENQTRDSVVYTLISATDTDLNDLMMFNLTASAQTTDKDKFRINPSTGHLTLTGKLDFETVRFYQYTVTVTDKVGHNDSADVFITVIDVQDTPPIFTGEPFQTSILENAISGMNLLTVRAEDGDRGVPNKVTLNITNETCKGLFQVDATSGVVSLKGHADRDAGDVLSNNGICTLGIQATEDNQQPQTNSSIWTATTNVTITIMDANDNHPEFSNAIYNLSVDENKQQGALINIQVPIKVTDKDQGNNAVFDVKVTILQDYFEVTPSQVQSTGDLLIRVKNSTILDYEKNHTLHFKIEAKDTYGSSTATVTIHINNINDNSPIFKNSTYHGSIKEMSSAGTSVIQITATDGDENDGSHNYGTVTYSLEGSNADFQIDHSGTITVGNKFLDRETKDVYYLTVVGEDGGSIKASTMLEIRITDINDNRPTFVTRDYQTSLDEGKTVFMRPVTIFATDNDAPNSENSEVVYSIISTEPKGLDSHFRVDPKNGTLTVNAYASLKYEDIKFLQGQEGRITLTVQAQDKGNPPLNSTVGVVVLLQDVNNNPPTCSNTSYLLSVLENSTKSSPIFKVNATDNDGTEPNNLFQFSIDQENAGNFIISSTTGWLSLRDKLDREQKDHYEILVNVTDLGIPSLTGCCTIFLNVTDINDEPPVFEKISQPFYLTENTTGQTIQIKADDKDIKHKLVYSIKWEQCSALNQSGQSINVSILQNWIRINNTTGLISINNELDRERVISFKLVAQVEDVYSDNGLQIDTVMLSITVKDKNDELPQFTNGPSYKATIRENVPPNTDIIFDTPKSLDVFDADEIGPNSAYTILLLTHNTIFSISPPTGTSRQSFNIHVLNSSALDYEVTQSFTLKVLAKDPNNSDMNSSATIIVDVTNENDNIPEFLGGPYTGSVIENSTYLTPIIKVNATDKDLGVYGQLTYSWEGSSNTFSIDKKTGDVFLNNVTLDRENKSSYTVTVIATDGGGFRATTQLTIRVLDVNDNPPKFNHAIYNLTLNENSIQIYPALSVQATDEDDPQSPNSKIIYSLLDPSSSLSSHFSIDKATGEFTIANPLDSEALNGTFTITVLAEDQGTPSYNATALVRVTVNDTNDNDPEFDHQVYATTVPENAIDYPVVSVHATDGDVSPNNNNVTYKLDTFSANIFDIDIVSGFIKIGGRLDREQTPQYTIIVTAQDNGKPTRTSTALVNVTVSDINDSPPTFSWDSKSTSVTENSNGTIIQNNATDPDQNPNLVYSILWSESSGMDGSGQFLSGESLKDIISIDNSTGEVYPINQLDREKVQRFQLTLVVNDTNNVPGTKNDDTAILTVVVEDENDNHPTFNQDYFTAAIQENMPVGSEIKMINVSALIITDADAGDNSKFNISLEDNSVFNIYPSEGSGSTACIITVANSSVLDYEERQNITIKVIATELGTKQYNSTITIFIININDNFPQFNSSVFDVSATENLPQGHYITSLKAHDDDLQEFGIVHYFVVGTNTGFLIDNETGTVTLNMSKFDRETKDSYTIAVKAKDMGGFEGSTQLTIRLIDENDERPEFQKPFYEAEFQENDVSFKFPLIVKATDDDAPNTKNSEIVYSITWIPPEISANQFSVNSASGEITLTSNATDYEKLVKRIPDGIIHIKVTATDCGVPPRNSSVWVNITVTDANDEYPTFKKNNYVVKVLENSTQGVNITSVDAYDNDVTSPNKDFYYVIQSGSRDKLQINSSTGIISIGTGAKLDRETTEKYGFNLIVLAIDKGTPSRTGTTSVLVEVTDVNDTPPKITSTYTLFSVYENVTVGSEIIQFNATDEDENANLTFKVLWSESHAHDEKERDVRKTVFENWLSINESYGTITVNSRMDREQVEQMILKIVVTDQNTLTGDQEATATVTVSLLDVNDNHPKISTSSDMLQLNVSEGTKIGTEVTTLTATDADKEQTVKFSLANADASFDIKDSDKLTLSKTLDRETEPKLKLVIIATDDGTPALSSSISVIINVLDINDNDPEFNITHFEYHVLEDADNTTWVANITATDDDEGDNGNVTYEFKDTSPFRIDPISGSIYVSEALDREKTPSYTLTVIATDNPLLESRRRTPLQITIFVDDINDNKPNFAQSSYQGEIVETAAIGSTISIKPESISASDEDIEINSIITYSIMCNDSNNGYFGIIQHNGVVQVRKNITGQADVYSCMVNASDHGNVSLSSNVSVIITVRDENINPPVFVKAGPLPPIPECIEQGRSLYTFSATDADKDKETNGKVKYFLEPGIGNNYSLLFDLNEDSGKLTTSKNSDFDNENFQDKNIVITVIARDMGLPPLDSKPVKLDVIVTDINDNSPAFKQGIDTHFYVNENHQGIKVGSVMAVDYDDYPKLTYKISGIDDMWKDYFFITDDPNAGGIIYLNKSLDREMIGEIKMEVTATDMTDNAQQTLCPVGQKFAVPDSLPLEVTVTIEDVNDNPPVFKQKSMSLGFLSSTKFGETIISLQGHVTDNDTAPNSVHKFYQVSDIQKDSDISKTWTTDVKSDPIKVDINGTISTNYKFSEDAFGSFKLQVLANDSAGSDKLDLRIYVVGNTQVVHMTLYYSEDELRQFQYNLTEELGRVGYKFVPDNILPARSDKTGEVDSSKSVLVVHAVDADGNIVDGKALQDKLDQSLIAHSILDNFRVLKTVIGAEADRQKVDDTDEKIKGILYGAIGALGLIFIITIVLLVQSIRRFKRKLKAATIDVHREMSRKQDNFPGLDNHDFKLANPIFNRDDLVLDESKFADNYAQHDGDTLSNASENSLDQNAINSANAKEKTKTVLDEQEVTLDIYGNDDADPRSTNLYSHLYFRQSDFVQQERGSSSVENKEGSSDVGSDEDLDETVNVNLSHFESTDI